MSQPDSAAQAAPNEPGFFPEFSFVAPDEVDECDQMIRGYGQQFDPHGALQNTVFQNLIHAAWELVRCRRMEAALCGSFRSYTDLMQDDKVQRKLDWIARRKGQFERSFNRSLKEMKALKAEEPPPATVAPMTREQLKATAEKIIAERKTKISERSHPRPSPVYDETKIHEAA